MKPTVHISSTRQTERPCPVCHARLDGVTCLSLRRPTEPQTMRLGDITKCGYCGAMLKLLEFGFVLADPKDLEGIPSILQRVQHEMPLLSEIKSGKRKKPS